MPALVRDLAAEGLPVHFTLTDRFPNLSAFRRARLESAGAVSFVEHPVDARAVPSDLTGFRTLFNSFHHFRPGDARAILSDAVATRQPIGIFEISERSLAMILPALLTPLSVLLATPFLRPFRWQRLLWTYVVPVVPLFCLWDGLVSQLRAYRVEELEGLIADLATDAYSWKAGRVRLGPFPGHLTYLVGQPRPAAREP